MPRVVYESNGATVGDGVRITRVADDGQTLEVMVDAKTERFSRIILEPETDMVPLADVERMANQLEFDRAIKPPADDLIYTVGTPGVAANEYYDPRKLMWLRDVVIQANEPGMTIEATIAYLFDTIKFLHCVQIPGYVPEPGTK